LLRRCVNMTTGCIATAGGCRPGRQALYVWHSWWKVDITKLTTPGTIDVVKDGLTGMATAVVEVYF
jgi:hypothetical protein